MEPFNELNTAQLYATPYSVIRQIMRMEDTGDILSAASPYIVKSMFLSGYSLLRLLETTLAKRVNVLSGQTIPIFGKTHGKCLNNEQ